MNEGLVSVTDLLGALVRIPSVNPESGAGTGETGEAEVADFVGGFLAGLGAEVAFEEVRPGRPNVIGRFPSHRGEGKPVVALAPHTDTVGVEGMTVEPFGGEVRDGRLFGRGACDTKGTMAAMLWALRELGSEGIAALGCRVVFVGLMGEETSQHGSKHFARHHAGEVDFALVGEPTGCDAVIRTKGALWPRLTVGGRAAHGSRPELGDNAIVTMAKVVEALDTRFRERLRAEEWTDPLLGASTLNIGIVRGGSRPNIVADRCELELDVRATPALHRTGALEALAAFLGDEGFDVSIEAPAPSPPLETDAANPFVRVLESIGARLAGAPWFSDASWLSEGGIPCAIAGPGDIAQAHTADEWIDLGELARGVRFYREFLERCGREP